MKPLQILPVLFCLLVTGCRWFGKDPRPELPPPTQEGNNTFGCYLNGKPWTPKGRAGTISNLNMTYDPNYAGGSFELRTSRFEDSNRQYLKMYSFGLSSEGTYSLNLPGVASGAHFTNLNTDINSACEYNDDSNLYRSGSLTITRFDLQARVIAGTFEFTLARPGCDTVRVTEGRFDLNYN